MGETGVYVVRVYRRDSAGMTGVVESVESGESVPFQSNEQLWHALQDLPSPRPRHPFNQSDQEEGT
jgi:hypothetical protein